MKLLITSIALVLTITELFANKNNYANKIVKIKGEVKKYNTMSFS